MSTKSKTIQITYVLGGRNAAFGSIIEGDGQTGSGVYIPESLVEIHNIQSGQVWRAVIEPSGARDTAVRDRNPWQAIALSIVGDGDEFPDQIWLTPDGEDDFMWDDQMPNTGERGARYVRVA